MQVKPATAKWLATKYDWLPQRKKLEIYAQLLLQEDYGLLFGVAYYKKCRELYRWNWRRSIVCYNAGHGKAKRLTQEQIDGHKYLKKVKDHLFAIRDWRTTMKFAEMSEPEQARFVRRILDYDEHSGKLYWNKDVAYNVKSGDLAGYKSSRGYINIKIHGKMYLAHRLAWLYSRGVWPQIIDHINGIKDDNRLLGYFKNISDAAKARKEAEKYYDYHPNHGRV